MRICSGDGGGGGGGGVGPDAFTVIPPLKPAVPTSYDVELRAHFGKAELRIGEDGLPDPAAPPLLQVDKGVAVGVFAAQANGELFVSVTTPDDPKVGYHWRIVEQGAG